MDTRLDRFQPDDTPAVLRLLADNGLPTDGLLDHLDDAVVLRAGDQVVACAALEHYADGALLRSVAVHKDFRGSGFGHQIVMGALDMARERGARSVYLLTTTAQDYFPRFGFAEIVRDDVPPGVRTSIEFQSACPASAIVMAANLASLRRA